MGKIGQTLAVIGLSLIATPIAGTLVGATSGLAFNLVRAGIASILGAAVNSVIADAPPTESYAGTKLQNNKSNTNVVPENYGQNRVGGNVIWQGTRNTDNNDLYQIIVLGTGGIESIDEYYANNEILSSVGLNGVYNSSDNFIQILGYTEKPITINAPTGSSGTVDDLETLFSPLSFDDIVPNNLSFLVVRQVYSATDNPQVKTITATISGNKVRTITDSSTISATKTYSNNPAEIVLELLLEALNISESNIDIPSFYNAKTKCVTYGYTCNISFNSASNIQSLLTEVLSTFRGQLVHSQNVWKLKMDEAERSIDIALTEDDIVNNSLNISMKGFQEIANKIETTYINPDDEWLSAVVSSEDTDLVAIDGQEITLGLQIKGVTNTTQAEKLSQITLNTMRYSENLSGVRIKQTPLVISCVLSLKNANIEVGDLISLEHSLLDRLRKFIILSIETDQSGALTITAREHCETHFKDEEGAYII